MEPLEQLTLIAELVTVDVDVELDGLTADGDAGDMRVTLDMDANPAVAEATAVAIAASSMNAVVAVARLAVVCLAQQVLALL